MSTGENIRNALQVLTKTYQSTQKLLSHCRTLAEERGYLSASDRFLRWRSDQDPAGWLLNSVIQLFQWSGDPECPSGNGFQDGPTYGVEVFLGSHEADDLPQLFLARYDFEGVNDWTARWSPADHWLLYHPLHKAPDWPVTASGRYQMSLPDTPRTSERYSNLTRVLFRSVPLVDVTPENLESLVFDTFDDLAQQEPPTQP